MTLREMIVSGEIGGFCLDASLFISQAKKSFESSHLKLLASHSNEDFQWLMPKILLGEMRKHSIERYKQLYEQAKVGLRKLAEYQGDYTIENQINLIEPESRVDRAIQSYQDRKSFFLLSGEDHLNVDDLVDCYLNSQSPFSLKKKTEFPDAIILKTLFSWSQKNNKRILLISKDKDWLDFSKKNNESFVFLDDMNQAIKVMNEIVETRREKISEILEVFTQEMLASDGGLHGRLVDLLLDKIEREGIYVEASSSFYYEPEIQSIDITALHMGSGKDNILVLDSSSPGCVTLNLNVDYELEVGCSFSLYAEGGDYYIGSAFREEVFQQKASVIVDLLFNEDYDVGGSDIDLNLVSYVIEPSDGFYFNEVDLPDDDY